MMRTKSAWIALLAGVVLAGPAPAGEPNPEFRFGVIVTKGSERFPIPGALVSDNPSPVTIGLRSEDPTKPSLHVRCRMEKSAAGKLSAHFTALVNERDVASGTIALDRSLKELELKAPPYVFAIEIAPFEKGAPRLTSARLLDEQRKAAEAQYDAAQAQQDKEILARAGLRGETRFKASWAKFSFSHPKAWTAEPAAYGKSSTLLVDPEKLARDVDQKNMPGVALFVVQSDWMCYEDNERGLLAAKCPERDHPQALRDMATIKYDEDDENAKTATVSAPVRAKISGLAAYVVELGDSKGAASRMYFIGGKDKVYQLTFVYYDRAAPALTPAQQKVLGSFRELAR